MPLAALLDAHGIRHGGDRLKPLRHRQCLVRRIMADLDRRHTIGRPGLPRLRQRIYGASIGKIERPCLLNGVIETVIGIVTLQQRTRLIGIGCSRNGGQIGGRLLAAPLLDETRVVDADGEAGDHQRCAQGSGHGNVAPFRAQKSPKY